MASSESWCQSVIPSLAASQAEVQGMYANALSRVSVVEGYSAEFEEKAGVHQGLVLSPLLIILLIIVLEALSHEFHSGVP